VQRAVGCIVADGDKDIIKDLTERSSGETLMVLEKGDKIHVLTRRNFENDLRRHFIGAVLDVTDSTVRVEGYAFIFDVGSGGFVKKPDRRMRIFGLVDTGLIIFVLPAEWNLEKTSYQRSSDNQLVVTDGTTCTLDINEFGIKG
jgi:hypothetical protein